MSRFARVPAVVRAVPVAARAVATLLVLLVMTLAAGLLPAQAASADTPGPFFGLLSPTDSQLTTLTGTAVERVTLASGWDVMEPGQNVFDTNALAALRSRLDTMRADGFAVVLDLGLQYPPSWVFSLPGATRFVDQYGDAWHGSLSEDVPNAVFNNAVRAAEAKYIAKLASVLGPANLTSIRVGGLLSGELRYPPQSYNGHSNLIWDYDSAAQANAPVPGWQPGAGTTAQAQSSLNYYFNSLTAYERWMITTVQTNFPGVDQEVMFPGWGLRPNMVATAISGGMNGQSIAEVNGMISAGSDWVNQVKLISTLGINGTVYTTWLDAPTQNSTPQGIAPVDYLVSLAAKFNLPVAGENTGGGGTAALNLCLQRVQADGLTGMMYMSGGVVDAGLAGLGLGDLVTGAASLDS